MKIKFWHVVSILSFITSGIIGFGTRACASDRDSVAYNLPNPLTLDEAIKIALRLQPQVHSAETNVIVGQAAITQAKAKYLPTITPTYTYSDQHDTYYGATTQVGSGGAFNQVVSIDGTTTTRGGSTAITLNQNLFDSGSREVTNAQARLQLASALQGVRSARQSVIDNVTQAFYECLRDSDLLAVSNVEVARAEAVVAQTQGQIDSGVAAQKTIYQSKADLANAQVTQLQAKDALDNSITTLKNRMGIETADIISPAPLPRNDQTLPLAPRAYEKLAPDAYLALAYANRPDFSQQQVSVDQAVQSIKLAKIASGVSTAGALSVVSTPQNDNGTKGNNLQFQVQASYPLFDGGATRAGVRSAQAQRDAALDSLILLRQQIQLDITSAMIRRAEAYQRIGLAKAAVDAGQVDYDSAVESNKEGVGATIDITQAQLTLTQAENQYVAAIYDYYEAQSSLDKAIGLNDKGYPAK